MIADNPRRPMSAKEISRQAADFQFTTALTLEQWLRTAKTLDREARSYLQDGNFHKAFMLYLRLSDLLMTYLPKHPQAKTPEGKRLMKQARSGLEDIFKNLEMIRPIINREYDEWLANEARRNGPQIQNQADADADAQATQTTYEKHAARDPTLSSKAKVLDAGEHLDLAVDLAKKEFNRRDADRRASRLNGLSTEEEQSRRTAGFWNAWTDELAKTQAESEEIFRQKTQSIHGLQDGPDNQHIHEYVTRMGQAERERDELSTYRPLGIVEPGLSYPSITRSTPVQYQGLPRPDIESLQQPPRPPKAGIPAHFEIAPPQQPIPELPSKEPLWPPMSPQTIPQVHQSAAPVRPPKELDVEPPKKTSNREHLTFKPAAYLENGEPMRCVILPSKMRLDFLRLAAHNTQKGLEMCGVLCGTAVNNALFVRCLVIPEQRCTSDTCETENEGALFDFCDKEDLIQLGWIHTHPTQTCFMSSRDLHTQSGYQVMLPESIAIVCAPTDNPSYGIFRLTNPPGLGHVLDCTLTSTFHPHSVDNLYTSAGTSSGGHVLEHDNLEYQIRDLRPGKDY